MFSPLNDPNITDWFECLDAPLKRLPAAERQQLHEEVRQHLDALMAANEELGSTPEEAWKHALAQFGEPSKFGKRMAWEWRRKHGFLGPQIAAILYGVAVCSASMLALAVINWLVIALPYYVVYYVMNIILVSNPFPVDSLGFLVVPIVTGAAIGRKYPHQSSRGSFYAACLWPGLPATTVLLAFLRPCLTSVVQINWICLTFYCLAFPAWFLLTCGAAYFASVTKRGWYRPTWGDFKITLPKRQIAE